jgi:putative Mn2+ efflux pump MntP
MMKYSKTWLTLNTAGWGIIVVVQHFFPKSPVWISSVGYLLIAVGLVYLLVGVVAERRELEAKDKTETGD